MKPKKSPHQNKQYDLFRSELVYMINPNHSLVKLSKVIDWRRLEEIFGISLCADNGRPALWRFMVIRMMGIPFQIPLSRLPDYHDYPSKCMLIRAFVGVAGMGIPPFVLISVGGARPPKVYGGG